MIRISPGYNDTDNSPVALPYSKSIRSRILMMAGVNGTAMDMETDSDDVEVMRNGIRLISGKTPHKVTIDIKQSGTALRFLTALCATTPGQYTLTGDTRLCERPVKELVEALKSIGADIKYVGNEGHAPLEICGRKLSGGRVDIAANVSSQYISALMLAGADMENGIEIHTHGERVSESYIELTRHLMETCGINITKNINTIKVNKGRYDTSKAEILAQEKDWSAAAVWFALTAITENNRIILNGLNLKSKQPDSKVADIFGKLGVIAHETQHGVILTKEKITCKRLNLDCLDNPDIIMTVAATCALLDVKFEITGAQTLKSKECDRGMALTSELRKCGYHIEYDGNGKLWWNGKTHRTTEVPEFETYGDHRMAMTMALVGLKKEVKIKNEQVTDKSYKEFWSEFRKYAKIETCDEQ